MSEAKINRILPKLGKTPLQTGFLISFSGSLPPGVITLCVLQLSATTGPWAGLNFSFGSLVVEMLFVWSTLSGLEWLSRQQRFFAALHWFSLLVMLVLAVGAGWTVLGPQTGQQQTLFELGGAHPLWKGALLRLLTPTMIPFWLGWNAVLLGQQALLPTKKDFRRYVLGIGLGTFGAHLVIVVFSQTAQTFLADLQTSINWLVFIALSVTCLIKLGQLFHRAIQVRKNT